MKRTGTWLIVLLLGLFAAFAAWSAWPPVVADPGGTSDGSAAAAVPVDGSIDGVPTEFEGGSASREVVEDAAPARAEDSSESFRVRGRCVHARTRAPIPACAVHGVVHGVVADEPLGEPIGSSDAEGSFYIALDVDGDRDVELRLIAAGFAPSGARLRRPAPGAELELGDVPLLPAVEIHGTIVDDGGAAIVDAGIMFVMVLPEHDHRVAPETTLRARSDARGSFRFERPAWPGEWYVGVQDTGALVGPRSVRLVEGESPFELRITVERPDPSLAIRGTVVDEAGQPLAGIEASFAGAGFRGQGRSRTDGSFVAHRAGPAMGLQKAGIQVGASDPRGRYEQVAPVDRQEIDWGHDGVRIVMRPRATLGVRVVDERGASVTDYALFAFQDLGDGLVRYSRIKVRGHHDEGRCELVGLRRGRNALVVVPRRDDLGATDVIRFDVESAVGQGLVVTVPSLVATRFEVETTGGRPVAESRVEILRPLVWGADEFVPDPIDIDDLDRQGRVPHAVRVGAAITDDAGACVLRVPPGAYGLRVRGPTHVTHERRLEVTAAGAPVRIVVSIGGTLVGSLAPASAVERMHELTREGRDQRVAVVLSKEGADDIEAEVDASGRFELRGIPPGDYDAKVRYWMRNNSVQNGDVACPVGPVTIVDGAETAWNATVNHMLPGSVRGRVLVDGEPLREVHCFLRASAAGRARSVRVATDADGWFDAVVPRDDYGFAITLPSQPGPGWVYMVLPDRCRVEPNSEHEWFVSTTLRRIRLRLLDRDRQPVVAQQIRLDVSGFHLPGRLISDAAGVVELAPAPPGAFHVEVSVDGTARRLGPFDLPPGVVEGEIEVGL